MLHKITLKNSIFIGIVELIICLEFLKIDLKFRVSKIESLKYIKKKKEI